MSYKIELIINKKYSSNSHFVDIPFSFKIISTVLQNVTNFRDNYDVNNNNGFILQARQAVLIYASHIEKDEVCLIWLLASPDSIF